MQTKHLPVLLFPLLFLLSDAAEAQQRRNVPSSSERIARARWQPVRHNHVDAEYEEYIVDEESVMLDGPAIQGPYTVMGEPGMMGNPGAMGPGGGCDARGCSAAHPCGMTCDAWQPCLTICLPRNGWASVEYLRWWQDSMDLPPLVTTSLAGTARPDAGVLGRTGTSVLYGDEGVLNVLDGIRLRTGVWLDGGHRWGIQGEYIGMGTARDRFSATSNGNPILARPFFNMLTGQQDAALGAFPDVIGGTIDVEVDSQLRGASFHARRLLSCRTAHEPPRFFCNLPATHTSRFDALIGYRYLQLNEGIGIFEDQVAQEGNSTSFFLIEDHFRTRTQFNGFDFGLNYTRTRGRWTADILGRIAAGVSHQRVTIDGSTRITEGANVENHPGGMLAQRSNMGTFTDDRFTMVPELNLTLAYQVTPRLRATMGYTFLYWSNVARAGEQIDLDLNPNLLPPEADPFSGPLRPEFDLRSTDYWVQGINFGGEFRW